MKRYAWKTAKKFYKKLLLLQTRALMHSTHHLTQSNRTIFEICFWWLMLSISTWTGVFTASVFIRRHIEHPTVISIERDYTTWNTTFPAFTLCSKRKINETALQGYLYKTENRHFDRNKTEQFLRTLVNLNMYNLNTFIEFAEIKGLDYLSIVDELTNRYDYDVVIDAPNKLRLERTITEMGICDTFNSKLTPHLTPMHFSRNLLPPKMPSFQINYLDANAFVMINDLQGSDIYFHGPYDLPSAIPFVGIGANSTEYAGFVFSALTMLADPKVRRLFIGQRKCRYLDESNLENFPWIYSFDLCKIQCKIDMMKAHCGCVPFFYKKRDNEVYCESFSCIRRYGEIIQQHCYRFECAKNCVDVKFNVKKLSKVAWFRDNSFRIDLDKPKLRMKREVIYSLTDVLIATGATFALFVGSGALSLARTVYFAFDMMYKCMKK